MDIQIWAVRAVAALVLTLVTAVFIKAMVPDKSWGEAIAVSFLTLFLIALAFAALFFLVSSFLGVG